MATFRFTSVEWRSAALVFALLLFAMPCVRAGSIVTLTNGSEGIGKLSIAGGAIHAEGPSAPSDTSLTDVLQATFDDTPFTLSVFHADKLNQLPPNWSAQNVGEVAPPGSVTVQDGAFTVTGAGMDRRGTRDVAERVFFAGAPWPEDGVFTAHVASLDAQGDAAWAGLMFRDSLDPKSLYCGAVLNGLGQIRVPQRRDPHREETGEPSNGQAPIWLRFTREGNTVFTSTSSDGNDWNIIAECPFKELTSPLVGFAARGPADKGIPKAVLDHVSLTPLPSSAQVLPAGVLLQGGSLLAGRISHINLDPSTPDNGEFLRGDDKVQISRSVIAGIVMLPITRAQLADTSTKAGLVMRNGDTMDGDVGEISTEQISVSSVLLGLSTYKTSEVRACFTTPLQVKTAPYEVRLRDGSILYATAITGDASGVQISDVSGLNLNVGQDEIAQIRAGNAAVQELAQLDWKATGAKDAPTPQVDSWLGKDQQQILETDPGTAIEFPLPGKFRAFGVQVVLGADSPANATAVIHFLTDGHELAKSPALRVGDPPRFMELTLPTASHITVQSESTFPGTKVLYLDPVGIR
jgi:hypothetical protein